MKQALLLFLAAFLTAGSIAQERKLIHADLVNGNYRELMPLENIVFRVKNSPALVRGIILAVYDSSILFRTDSMKSAEIRVNDIEAIVQEAHQGGVTASPVSIAFRYSLAALVGLYSVVAIAAGMLDTPRSLENSFGPIIVGAGLGLLSHSIWVSAKRMSVRSGSYTNSRLILDGVHHKLIVR